MKGIGNRKKMIRMENNWKMIMDKIMKIKNSQKEKKNFLTKKAKLIKKKNYRQKTKKCLVNNLNLTKSKISKTIVKGTNMMNNFKS